MKQEMAKAASLERDLERRPKALPGWEKPTPAASGGASGGGRKNAPPRLPAELVTEVASQMAGSMGSLNALVWQLEGVREIVQVRGSIGKQLM